MSVRLEKVRAFFESDRKRMRRRYIELVHSQSEAADQQTEELSDLMLSLGLTPDDLAHDEATVEKARRCLRWIKNADKVQQVYDETNRAATAFAEVKRAKIAELEAEHIRLGNAAIDAGERYNRLRESRQTLEELQGSHADLVADLKAD
jgi:hypothetical protein